jgi:hypothetical protein
MYTRVLDPDSMTLCSLILWIRIRVRIHHPCIQYIRNSEIYTYGCGIHIYKFPNFEYSVYQGGGSGSLVDPDWIQTQWLCGSGFTDNVVLDPYPDPDWPKLLDPDPDWINTVQYCILCIGLQMSQSRKESRIIFSYWSRSHINTDGSYGGLQKRFSSYSKCVVDPHCYVAPQHLYEWGAIF